MKKTAKFLLLTVLAFSFLISMIACTKTNKQSETSETRMTIELVTAGSDDALLTEDDLPEGEGKYYTVTGYTFSESDAQIVTYAADDKYYYTDYYTGTRGKDKDYLTEKERYNELTALTLPKAVKVATSDAKIYLTAERLAKVDANGVIDLSNGSANAKTLYIRTIDANAFLNHTELKAVVVPETYLAIGDGAFSGCGNLEEMTIPFVGKKTGAVNGGKNFGYIFGTYEYTNSVSAAQNYNLSGSATYYVPADLRKVTVTADVTPYAFYNVTTVEEVVYNYGDVIPAYAFYGCTGLKSLELPASIKEIGEGAYGSCNKLNKVNFTALTALEKIGANAFAGCTMLGYTDGKVLNLPASVKFIGEQAFANCTSIEKFVFEATEQAEIKAQAFSGLTSLEEVTIKNALMSIGAFDTWSEMLTATLTDCTVVGGGDLKLAFIGAITAEDAEGKEWLDVNFKLN